MGRQRRQLPVLLPLASHQPQVVLNRQRLLILRLIPISHRLNQLHQPQHHQQLPKIQLLVQSMSHKRLRHRILLAVQLIHAL